MTGGGLGVLLAACGETVPRPPAASTAAPTTAVPTTGAPTAAAEPTPVAAEAAVTGRPTQSPATAAAPIAEAPTTAPTATAAADPRAPVAASPPTVAAPRPTVAAPRPTAAAARPTAAAPPTPSPTPAPALTAAPTPTPTATSTITSTPTPTPPPLTSPLTGLAVTDDVNSRRVVAVKIDNAPEARPQSGLGEAGVVYQHLTEGPVTRYTAFFHDSDLEQVGPIRSGRFVDRELVQQFDALFAHVGGSPPVLRDLRAAPVADMDQFFFDEVRPYFRIASRPPPFNMYASLPALREFGRARHPDRREIEGLVFYHEEPEPGGVRAVMVPAGSRGLFQSTYEFQPATRRWLRSIGGVVDIDAASGVAIAPENVIVQRVPMRLTEFEEDSLGNRSLWIGTTGEGTATIFRDGRRIECRWRRAAATAVTRFETGDGLPVLLRPGHTWVHLIGADDSFESA